jgi:hypothetical protein
MSMSNLARRRTLDAKYDILATLSAVAYSLSSADRIRSKHIDPSRLAGKRLLSYDCVHFINFIGFIIQECFNNT